MDNSSLYPIKCFQFGPWKKRNVSMEWSHTGYSFYLFRNLLDYHQKIYCFSNEILHQNSTKTFKIYIIQKNVLVVVTLYSMNLNFTAKTFTTNKIAPV